MTGYVGAVMSSRAGSPAGPVPPVPGYAGLAYSFDYFRPVLLTDGDFVYAFTGASSGALRALEVSTFPTLVVASSRSGIDVPGANADSQALIYGDHIFWIPSASPFRLLRVDKSAAATSLPFPSAFTISPPDVPVDFTALRDSSGPLVRVGDRLYVSYYEDDDLDPLATITTYGVAIVDVSTPTSPALLGNFTFPRERSGATYVGMAAVGDAVYVFYSDSNFPSGGYRGHLITYDVSDAGAVVEVDSILDEVMLGQASPTNRVRPIIDGSVMYLTVTSQDPPTYNWRGVVLDVSDEHAPSIIRGYTAAPQDAADAAPSLMELHSFPFWVGLTGNFISSRWGVLMTVHQISSPLASSVRVADEQWTSVPAHPSGQLSSWILFSHGGIDYVLFAVTGSSVATGTGRWFQIDTS